MATIRDGRWTADIDGDFVVFLIGFRASPTWRIVKALPLLASMPKMLADLERDQSKGLLGYRLGGPFGTIVQYWRSFQALETFARSPDDRHAEVWRQWYRRAQHLNPSVGIWHETYTCARAGTRRSTRACPRTSDSWEPGHRAVSAVRCEPPSA